MHEYLSGEKLIGDDYLPEQIDEWYKDEEEGYYKLGKNSNPTPNHYSYHALNNYYGYRYINNLKFNNVLGIGSAFGDEFLPILHNIDNLTIIEPSTIYWRDDIDGHKVKYMKPKKYGNIDLESNSLDLVVCFGVLHHICNVSFVVSEIERCLKSGGYFLVREPIVSMGDWSTNRIGLTKRERGIPANVFENMLKNFEIIQVHKFAHPFSNITRHIFKKQYFQSVNLIKLDKIFSKVFCLSRKYHARNIIDKIRPTSIYYVLRKK